MLPKNKISWNAIPGILMLLFATLTVLAFRAYVDTKADRDRLQHNQSLLLHNGRVEISETGTGRSHASTPALTLRPEEFRQSGGALAEAARQTGVKPSRISEAAIVATSSHADIEAPARRLPPAAAHLPGDSLCRPDSLVCFSWHDPWLSLSGCVSDSLFRGTVTATDTLDVIVHRVPRRFLFFRFGCREVRMDIVSRNPHTRLTYARYCKFVK